MHTIIAFTGFYLRLLNLSIRLVGLSGVGHLLQLIIYKRRELNFHLGPPKIIDSVGVMNHKIKLFYEMKNY